MKIIVYLEGPSDRLALESLLQPLIDKALHKGILISFIGLSPNKGRGNSKKELINKAPRKAVNILINNPNAYVCVMPDLYPKDIVAPHKSFVDLEKIIRSIFEESLKIKNVFDSRIANRFHVFCFKHDLESLILAAEEQLSLRLHGKMLKCIWIKPVEDQNHDTPPKRIVEALFGKYSDNYHGTVDAPLILGNADYKIISQRCPQCFKPFVDFLEAFIS